MSLFPLKFLQWFPSHSEEKPEPLQWPRGPWCSLTQISRGSFPSCTLAPWLFLEHRNRSHLRLPRCGVLFSQTPTRSPFFSGTLTFGWGLSWPLSTQKQNPTPAPAIPRPLPCFPPLHLLVYLCIFQFYQNGNPMRTGPSLLFTAIFAVPRKMAEV